MTELFRAAWVIARRDYAATVFSKTFILFLLGPLLPVLFGGGFGYIAGTTAARSEVKPRVAVAAPAADIAALAGARETLASRFGRRSLPELVGAPPGTPPGRLLADERNLAVLSGDIDHPVLTATKGDLDTLGDDVALIVDRAQADRALAHRGVARATVRIATATVPAPKVSPIRDQRTVARVAQMILFFLTLLLSTMLLSTLVEEKSNKVIEVLAAAVPVDAIFLGKLLAMLAMSLTGIVVWGAGAFFLLQAARPMIGALPVPAIGWPAFLALGATYFCTYFLLVGAVFLGIGGQASTVRQVQTLSMPVTMAQLGIVLLTTTAMTAMDGPLGLFAAIFPWSSPSMMIAHAAVSASWLPHLVAIGWQLLWVAIIVKVAAGLFRRAVLKSGGGLFSRKVAT